MRSLMLFVTVMACSAVANDNTSTTEELRDELLTAVHSESVKCEDASSAYSRFFRNTGRECLDKLLADEDIGVSLQSGWELYVKPAVPEQPSGGEKWAFEELGIHRFLALVSSRLIKPPDWWVNTLVKGKVLSDHRHCFIEKDRPVTPVSAGREINDRVVISHGGKSVEISKSDFEDLRGLGGHFAPTVLIEAEMSFIARPEGYGFPFTLMAVDSKTGKRHWSATVWAAGRDAFVGLRPDRPHPVEIVRHGDSLLVFGVESHALYVEGFSIQTGTCQFRFCSSCWMQFPEIWGAKN